MAFKSIGFGDDSVPPDSFMPYQPTAGKTDRLAILSGPQDILWAYVHYDDNMKFVICNHEGSGKGVCCHYLPPAQQRFGVVVFHYDADSDGDIINPNKCSGLVKLFILTENRYTTIGKIHKDYPLVNGGQGVDQWDLLVETPAKDKNRPVFKHAAPAHYKTDDSWYHQFAEVQYPRAVVALQSRLGQSMTDEEIAAKLGVPEESLGGSSVPFRGNNKPTEMPEPKNDADPFAVDLDLSDDDIPF